MGIICQLDLCIHMFIVSLDMLGWVRKCRWIRACTGLPQLGENVWKMKFFPGRGKIREFCGWLVEFRKDLESEGKVREFETKWLWQSSEYLFILFKRGKDVLSHEIV